jgi:hypothetical protein
MEAAYKKNNVPCQLLTIPGVGHGFDIGFKGFKPIFDSSISELP